MTQTADPHACRAPVTRQQAAADDAQVEMLRSVIVPASEARRRDDAQVALLRKVLET